MNQMKNLFMKQLLSLLLCLSIIVPSMAKKEQRKQNVFPDGTPISEWFLQTKVVHPDSLGKNTTFPIMELKAIPISFKHKKYKRS